MADNNDHKPLNHKISQAARNTFDRNYNNFENNCREQNVAPTKALYLEFLAEVFSDQVTVAAFIKKYPHTKK